MIGEVIKIGIPDKRNDQMSGSPEWGIRRKFNEPPRGKPRGIFKVNFILSQQAAED